MRLVGHVLERGFLGCVQAHGCMLRLDSEFRRVGCGCSSLDSCQNWRALQAAGHRSLASLRLHRTGIRVCQDPAAGPSVVASFPSCGAHVACHCKMLGAALLVGSLFPGLRHDPSERAIRGLLNPPGWPPWLAPGFERACLRLEISSQSGCPSRELEARRGRFRILSKEGRPCDAPFPS